MFGELASAVIVGSFCLFCENGVLGLPFVTNASGLKAAADAAAVNTMLIARIGTNTNFFIL
jgi:hypothetical protein